MLIVRKNNAVPVSSESCPNTGQWLLETEALRTRAYQKVHHNFIHRMHLKLSPCLLCVATVFSVPHADQRLHTIEDRGTTAT
jgi:hypothetical protein